MGHNATQFCKKRGIKNTWKVKDWYEAGYLGAAKRIETEKKHIYDIPEDTPAPYNANPRIKTITALSRELMKAAAHQRSVFPEMYPKLQPGTVERLISEFITAGYMRKVQTASGCCYLELTVRGYEFMNNLDDKQKESIYKKVERTIAAGGTLIQVLSVIIPLIA